MKNESEQAAKIFVKNSIFVLFLTSEGMLLMYFIIKYENGYWFKIAIYFYHFKEVSF